MKKSLLTFFALGSAASALAQLPVSTTPTNKRAVLEEFTGIHCGYCPDGHLRATNLYNSDPTNVILINIHSGGYANPSSSGDLDFRTPEGAAIDAMPGQLIAGYPAGTMNRKVFSSYSQSSGGMAQSRGSWQASASTIKSQAAYLNVALQGTIDVNTRLLTVEAQVYYTANSPVSSNSLTIMLLENGIHGPQSNYGTPYYNLGNYNSDGTYNHNHVLRACITPTFGQTIPVTTSGTTYTTTLTYNIPASYGVTGKSTPCVLANLEVVAFVTESDVNIINAAHGPLKYSGLSKTTDIGTNALAVEPQVCAGNLNPSFKFTNNGSNAVTSAVFSYAVNGGATSTYSWTGNINPLQTSSVITLPAMAFTPQNTNSLNINVVSVNGTTDQDASNNALTKTVSVTNNIANDLTVEVDFVQDRYGSESKWTVYDEVTGNVIETDGPFSDLGSAGTQLHTKSFNVDINTCYKIVVEDSGGNGINGYGGAGTYSVISNGDVVMSSNGKYAKGETQFFKTYTNVGITKTAMNVRSVKLYPNPTSGNITSLSVNLSQSETLAVNIVNSLGQQLYSKTADMQSGDNSLQINTDNLASGVYFVNVVSQKGAVQHKLIVSK
jgi:hypothetical protein